MISRSLIIMLTIFGSSSLIYGMPKSEFSSSAEKSCKKLMSKLASEWMPKNISATLSSRIYDTSEDIIKSYYRGVSLFEPATWGSSLKENLLGKLQRSSGNLDMPVFLLEKEDSPKLIIDIYSDFLITNKKNSELWTNDLYGDNGFNNGYYYYNTPFTGGGGNGHLKGDYGYEYKLGDEVGSWGVNPDYSGMRVWEPPTGVGGDNRLSPVNDNRPFVGNNNPAISGRGRAFPGNNGGFNGGFIGNNGGFPGNNGGNPNTIPGSNGSGATPFPNGGYLGGYPTKDPVDLAKEGMEKIVKSYANGSKKDMEFNMEIQSLKMAIEKAKIVKSKFNDSDSDIFVADFEIIKKGKVQGNGRRVFERKRAGEHADGKENTIENFIAELEYKLKKTLKKFEKHQMEKALNYLVLKIFYKKIREHVFQDDQLTEYLARFLKASPDHYKRLESIFFNEEGDSSLRKVIDDATPISDEEKEKILEAHPILGEVLKISRLVSDKSLIPSANFRAFLINEMFQDEFVNWFRSIEKRKEIRNLNEFYKLLSDKGLEKFGLKDEEGRFQKVVEILKKRKIGELFKIFTTRRALTGSIFIASVGGAWNFFTVDSDKEREIIRATSDQEFDRLFEDYFYEKYRIENIYSYITEGEIGNVDFEEVKAKYSVLRLKRKEYLTAKAKNDKLRELHTQQFKDAIDEAKKEVGPMPSASPSSGNGGRGNNNSGGFSFPSAN